MVTCELHYDSLFAYCFHKHEEVTCDQLDLWENTLRQIKDVQFESISPENSQQ